MYKVYNSPFLFRAQQCLPLYSEPSQHSWDIHNHKSNILVPSIASTFSCCIGKNVFDLTLFFHACHWLLPQNVSTVIFFFSSLYYYYYVLKQIYKTTIQKHSWEGRLGVSRRRDCSFSHLSCGIQKKTHRLLPYASEKYRALPCLAA